MARARIASIEWTRLHGVRPRAAGSNARLGPHGLQVSTPIARLTLEDGRNGFGPARLERDQAAALIGRELPARLIGDQADALWRAVEYPLADLAGKLAERPVYALVARAGALAEPLRVRVYDTSLYLDDLHLPDDQEAAAWLAAEALQGWERGHRAFKIKVGRGAMHLPLQQGTRRDILVIQAVRAAVGPTADLLIDANNGYNLNLARRVLAETAACRLYWLEEPFHEDARLLGHLKAFLAAEGLSTLLADGEGDASSHLLEWAQQGLIDVVQYDLYNPGLGRWLELGPQLDAWGVRSAPHHYGEPYGNYLAPHLATAIAGYQAVEWDEATLEGLVSSAYRVVEGQVQVPALPGFGLQLDETWFTRAVAEEGYRVS